MEHLYEILKHVDGYIYPNEIELQWGILIVLYPYITGLVAGAFILASLERVFKIKVLRPTYHLALLTALAFLLVAGLPLISHLGHPFRAYEILMTPHFTSAMAIFGFVYLWYLMVVLLLEIWFDYRRDLVIWSQQAKGFKRRIYKILTLGVTDLSPKARKTRVYCYSGWYSFSIFVTRICWFYIWICQSKSLVVVCNDACYFPSFCNGFRYRTRNVPVYGNFVDSKS